MSAVPRDAEPNLAISAWTILGISDIHTRRFTDAEQILGQASASCARSPVAACGGVFQARGLLASERGDSVSAEAEYQQALSFARSHQDKFLEATALLNLGAESLSEEHFDQALDRSEKSYEIAQQLDARIIQLVTQGNIGWASYRLGDSERGLSLFLQAEKRAGELGDPVDQGVWLTNAGYVYLDARDFAGAERAFQEALAIEERANRKEYVLNALRALARLYLESGELEKADQFASRAMAVAKEGGNSGDELYPKLLASRVAAKRGQQGEAEKQLHEIEQDEKAPRFLRWEAQHALGQLYESEQRPDDARQEYEASLSAFESARAYVRHEDFQVSFLTNARRIYDDFIHFLIAQGQTADALRWADFNRARTLADALGLLAKSAVGKSETGPPQLAAQTIAREAKGIILFYWLSDQSSYLWAITPSTTRLFPLPARSLIEAASQRYRRTLIGPQDVLRFGDSDGEWLYQTLIGPSQALLASEQNVYIIPDGDLNNLNFETLLVSQDKPQEKTETRTEPDLNQAAQQAAAATHLHFWIDDVTVANASSLRLLEASVTGLRDHPNPGAPGVRLLLIGNSQAPDLKYPELPRAAAQMQGVAEHFPSQAVRVFRRDEATPQAYLGSHPEDFAYIHFVAHGTASRFSPLDSAIILSNTQRPKTMSTEDSYKLYARDIVRIPLHAELVTIAACYGASGRAYSGEGLVGLSWAFLMAGAHNVIAALWEASDAPTNLLMNAFYDELVKGAAPDIALRKAKLSLLHGKVFNDPFYWAPFQLYVGAKASRPLARPSLSAEARTDVEPPDS